MNVNDKKTIVYSRNTVEFVTVAAEFCAYLEQSEGRKCRDFTDTVLKLLPLLYLKAALLEDIEGAEDFLPEAFVSEQDYEFVRLTLSALLGEKDDYLDFCNEGVKFSDEPAVKTISEDLADIYQDLKDFISVFQLGLNETMNDSLVVCKEHFREFWGQRLVNTMRALHDVKYTPADDDEEEEMDYAFQVADITQYSSSLYAFMDIDSMRDLFQTSSDYYNMVVSKKKLSIDSGKLYATTSKKNIEESSDIFINMMKPMMGMVVGLSVLIFGIVMYLMIKVMIDRSAQNIALMKVFGYRKKEIKKLYLDGNFYMIVIGALISVPLSKKLMDAMYPAMVSNIACGMNLSFSWQLYAMIYAGIIITYLVINKLLVRKIYKVGLSDALKNRE